MTDIDRNARAFAIAAEYGDPVSPVPLGCHSFSFHIDDANLRPACIRRISAMGMSIACDGPDVRVSLRPPFSSP